MDKFTGRFFLPHFFCDAHGLCVAGEEEDLLGLAEFHKEAQCLTLALFVEADEDVIQNDGERLELLAEGEGHGEANGKEDLIACTRGPDLGLFHTVLAVHDADIFPVFGDPKGILASGHSREESIRLLHDLRLAAGLIGGLRAVQDFFCVHVGQPFGECIGKLGFDLFFFLQANQLWYQIYQVVKENCSEGYSGANPQDDVMERLLRSRKG